jgi:EAL domain-containing protein (putative c-di-GMP-specific phosphodiesterase class I)
VLAPATLSESDIDTLAAMVDEVTPTLTRLLLLGGQTDHGPTEIAVPGSGAAAIEAAVRQTLRPAAPPPAPLTGEDVRQALHEGHLRMRFQPVVDAHSLQPLGLEALARLHHPTHGILRPADFMPAAIASGQERALTAIAAARTLQELRPLPGLDGLRFAINAPLTTLFQSHAAARAAELCAVAGIHPSRVVMEAIETLDQPDLPALGRALELWRRAGFHLTIDDAGLPLPHWRAMLELPFSGIKLDASLAANTAPAMAMAADIIASARQKGLYVVAEGIESAESAARLRDMGAHALQGFHISRPLPARAVPLWLEGRNVLF